MLEIQEQGMKDQRPVPKTLRTLCLVSLIGGLLLNVRKIVHSELQAVKISSAIWITRGKFIEMTRRKYEEEVNK